MKDYNEEDAIKMMAAQLPEALRDNDAFSEVLDLIYDYYDENGDLEIDSDEDEGQENVDEMANYICNYLRKNPPAVKFSTEEIAAMVRAEIMYEQSLLL